MSSLTRKPLHFFIFLFLSSPLLFSQTSFERIYYMGDLNIAHNIIATRDSNFLFCAGGNIPGYDFSWAVKVKPNGDVNWVRGYSTNSLASGKWVMESNDNHYMLLDEESYFDPLATGLHQVNINSAPVWDFKYPSASHTTPYFYYYGNHVEQLADSSYLIAGAKEPFGGGQIKAYLMNISKTGIFNWYTELMDTIDMGAIRVKQTADGGFIVLTNYTFYVASQLIKISPSGTILWHKLLDNFTGGGGNSFSGSTIEINNRDELIMSGSMVTPLGKYTPCLLKYSANGDSLWKVSYPNSSTQNLLCTSMFMKDENHFLLAVKSEKSIANKFYGTVYHTDSLLNVSSVDTVDLTRTHNCSWFLSIAGIASGGYCLAGTIDSISAFGSRSFVKVVYDTSAVQGIHEVEENASVNIYPNPGNGSWSLSYSILQGQQILFQLFDLAGRELYSSKLDPRASFASIDCSYLPAGIYFYKIMADHQLEKTGKLIITK